MQEGIVTVRGGGENDVILCSGRPGERGQTKFKVHHGAYTFTLENSEGEVVMKSEKVVVSDKNPNPTVELTPVGSA